MRILGVLYLGIENHPWISVFLATFFLGDEMVYLFAFLSGYEILKFWVVLIFATLGNGLGDLFWFSVARFKIFSKIKSKFITKANKDKEETKIIIKSIKHHRLFWLLVMSKFLYGTRLLMIFYTSKKEKNFKKLIFINSLAVISWVTIISFLLWAVGKWTHISFESINLINQGGGLAVIAIILIYLFKKFLLQRIFNFLLQIKIKTFKSFDNRE